MSDEVTAPSFDEAAQSFRKFLVAQGWPGHIVWFRGRDVIRRTGDPVTICRSEQADGERTPN